MYSNQEVADMHFMHGFADGNAALARVGTKKGIQDEDVQTGKYL
jgi:hypothetical protein